MPEPVTLHSLGRRVFLIKSYRLPRKTAICIDIRQKRRRAVVLADLKATTAGYIVSQWQDNGSKWRQFQHSEDNAIKSWFPKTSAKKSRALFWPGCETRPWRYTLVNIVAMDSKKKRQSAVKNEEWSCWFTRSEFSAANEAVKLCAHLEEKSSQVFRTVALVSVFFSSSSGLR